MKRAFIYLLLPLFAISVRGTEVRSVSVMEGDSVTLYTDVPEIQSYDAIRWRFGQQKSPIAEINGTAGIFNISDGPDGRFRERLELDHQTGSLTINKTEINHSGLYELEISSSGKHTKYKSINVTVGQIKTISLIEGDNRMDGERMFGDIANISEGRFSAYGGTFQDRLNNVTARPTTDGLSDGWIIGICAAAIIALLVIAAISMICGWCKLLLCWW